MTRLPVIQPRSCGSCTVCCETLQVASLGKGDYERCIHLRRGSIKGCGIYKDRPQDCSGYKCLWLANDLLDADFRPDRSGFILSASVFKIEDTEEPANPETDGYMMIHELVPGASRTGRAMKVIRALQEVMLVIEIQRDGIRKVRGGPPHLVERMVKIAKEMQEKGVPGFGLVKDT